MAFISYKKLWESEFDGIVSKRDKLQDLNINQLKLVVHDTYKKCEKITTNFEPIDNSDVINKGYLDSKLLKIDGHLSNSEKYFNEFKLQYNKQSVEEILIQRAVKTTIQILYDKGLFVIFLLMLIKFWKIFCLQQGEEVIYQKKIHKHLYGY